MTFKEPKNIYLVEHFYAQFFLYAYFTEVNIKFHVKTNVISTNSRPRHCTVVVGKNCKSFKIGFTRAVQSFPHVR